MAATKPRVLFINRSYWPDSEATGQLLTELCEDLAEDFEVSVVCGRPNHVQAGSPSRPPRHEHRRGVEIHRVSHTTFDKRSFVGKALNLVTFTLAAFVRTLWLTRPVVVVTETDPFFLPLLGRWLKLRYRCRFVAYLQDVYPDVAIAVDRVREGVITRSLRRVLVSACRAANRVVVLSEDMRDRCRNNGILASSIEIIPNWIDCERVRPVKHDNPFRQANNLAGKFVVMHSGNLGLAHLLTPLLDAAEQLQSRPDIQFLFVGDGVQRTPLMQEAQRRGLTNVCFLDYQPRETLAASLSAADLHVVSMRREVRGCVMPSKLYGILAVGCPILALVPRESDVARLVEEHALGVVCDSAAPSAELGRQIPGAILDLKADPDRLQRQGRDARNLAVEHFDRPIQIDSFRRLLNSLVGRDTEQVDRETLNDVHASPVAAREPLPEPLSA